MHKLPWDLDALPYVTLIDHATLPVSPGVYFVRTAESTLYIGATNNLHRRLKFHNRLYQFAAWPAPVMIAWMPFIGRKITELKAFEDQAITQYHPLCNRDGLRLPLRYQYRTRDDFEQALRTLTPTQLFPSLT